MMLMESYSLTRCGGREIGSFGVYYAHAGLVPPRSEDFDTVMSLTQIKARRSRAALTGGSRLMHLSTRRMASTLHCVTPPASFRPL